MFKKFVIFLSLFAASCSFSKREGPVVYFSNASSEPITNIQCNWTGSHLMSLARLDPGDSRSRSFYITSDSDFFGRIKISWNNSKGQRLLREFNFRENNLPSISDKTTYNYVQFYLDQKELEIVSSDAPDLSGKTRKMDELLNTNKAIYLKNTTQQDKSLISIKNELKNEEPIPYWLMSSY